MVSEKQSLIDHGFFQARLGEVFPSIVMLLECRVALNWSVFLKNISVSVPMPYWNMKVFVNHVFL